MSSSSCIFTATTTLNNTSRSLFKPSSLRPSTAFTSPFVSDSVSSDFSGHKLGSLSLTTSSPSSRPKRGVVTRVSPWNSGNSREPTPPDLASFFYMNRIVYLGMCLVPEVTRLIFAELVCLQYDDEEKPIYLYINSTGTIKNGVQVGYDTEAIALLDAMSYAIPPIFTLCVGNAWGEAALLLAAGAKGNRGALPSTTIMLKQPIGRYQGQASFVENSRKEMTAVKAEMVRQLSRHIGKTPEEIDADIRRPKYFSPSEAVEYGIIDKVVYNARNPRVDADEKKPESM